MNIDHYIEPGDLLIDIACHVPQVSSPSIMATGITLSEVEKNHILNTLVMLNNNKTKTAETLGISIRTLRNKLKEYNLS